MGSFNLWARGHKLIFLPGPSRMYELSEVRVEKNKLNKRTEECWLTLGLSRGDKGSEGGPGVCKKAGSILKGQPPFGSTNCCLRDVRPGASSSQFSMGAGFMGMQPRPPHQASPRLLLVLCCHYYEILNHFWARGPAFSFCTGLPKWCSQSRFQEKLCIQSFQ